MTAAAARALALAPAIASQPGEDRAGRVRALLHPEFLAGVWQADGEVFAPPRDHPLLGLRECAVTGCGAGIRSAGADLCTTCARKFRDSGLPMEEFTAIPPGRARRDEIACLVPECPRPSGFRVRLCKVHYAQWRMTRLPAEEWAASPAARPLPSFGECLVVSCSRSADGRKQLCPPHLRRWLAAVKQGEAEAGFGRWLAFEEPVNLDHFVILKGLPEQVRLEVLLALQLRADAGVKAPITALRAVVAALRQGQAATIDDLDETLIKRTRHDAGLMARQMAGAVQRALVTPAEEQRKDTWDLRVLGLGGWIRFAGISQDWLRETAKAWAAEDIPRHRGRQAAASAKNTVSSVGDLSASLRLARDDHGEDPAALSRRDIIDFTNRQAHLHRTGEITENMRLADCRSIRRFLADIRAMGLTKPGGIAAGLPDDFIMGRQDIPPEPDEGEEGRDLPAWVIKILDANLHVMEERSGTDMRRMTELMMDTGRRPDEICQLRLDCLERDAQGKPVLIYTDSKNHKPGRRLPIAEETARIIASQQADVRAKYPGTPPGDLPLFPRDYTNPDGTGTYVETGLSNTHRQWVNLITGKLVTTVTGEDGRPVEQAFDRLAVVPYAYRHSYVICTAPAL